MENDMEAIKERWIAHNQDCMPARLSDDTMVHVVVGRGWDFRGWRAGYFDWKSLINPIIGYRIVKGSEK